MKNRYRETVVLIVLLRTVDLLLTRIYTPDLRAEWNPVVTRLGASWPGFIAVQALLMLVVIVLSRFYFYGKRPDVALKRLGFSDFIYESTLKTKEFNELSRNCTP